MDDESLGLKLRILSHTYTSGTGVNISCSSFSICSSVLAFLSSEAVGGGSHDATRRWDFARATFARLNTISASLGWAVIVFDCSAWRNESWVVQSCKVKCKQKQEGKDKRPLRLGNFRSYRQLSPQQQ